MHEQANIKSIAA